MAKVMISLPDELLAQLDEEARRRGTSRSGLLRVAAQRELGTLGLPRDEIITRLDRLAHGWPTEADPASVLRADRQRVPGR